MAKLESTFKNMVISLVSIAVVAAAALAAVYTMTKDTIEEQKAEKQNKAILAVLPQDVENIFIAPGDTLDAQKDLIVFRAYTDSTMTTPLGAAVKISENGFGGKFKLMVGFDTDNNIINYSVLEHQETPGLGDKMGKWFSNESKPKSCVIGRNGADLTVSKGVDKAQIEANPEIYVDAITAATISSKAFLKAIRTAYAAYTGGKEEVDAATSASEPKPAQAPEVTEPEEEKVDATTSATQENEEMINEQMSK